MNAPTEMPAFSTAGLQPTPGSLATYLASVVSFAHDLKQKIAAGVVDQFVPASQAAGQSMGKVTDWVEGRLAQACETEKFIHAKLLTWIDAKIGSAEQALAFVQAKIDKANARLQKKEAKRKLRTADDSPSGVPNVAAIDQGATIPDERTKVPGVSPPGTLHTSPEGFPAPPTFEEIQHLVVPLAHDQGPLHLVQLPRGIWEPMNEQRTWLSLEETPLTRAEITALKLENGAIAPAGLVFLNSGLDLDFEAVRNVLDTLGIDQEAYRPMSREDAWARALDRFGPTVPTAVWDVYNLPHPDVIGGRMPPLGRVLAAAADENEENPVQGVGRALGGVLGRFLPNVPNPLDAVPNPLPAGLPNPADIIAGAAGLPPLRMPTIQELCQWFVRPWTWRGLDPSKMPPCATWDEMRRYLASIAHEDQ
jgi:hypothetical protein